MTNWPLAIAAVAILIRSQCGPKMVYWQQPHRQILEDTGTEKWCLNFHNLRLIQLFFNTRCCRMTATICQPTELVLLNSFYVKCYSCLTIILQYYLSLMKFNRPPLEIPRIFSTFSTISVETISLFKFKTIARFMMQRNLKIHWTGANLNLNFMNVIKSKHYNYFLLLLPIKAISSMVVKWFIIFIIALKGLVADPADNIKQSCY